MYILIYSNIKLIEVIRRTFSGENNVLHRQLFCQYFDVLVTYTKQTFEINQNINVDKS